MRHVVMDRTRANKEKSILREILLSFPKMYNEYRVIDGKLRCFSRSQEILC